MKTAKEKKVPTQAFVRRQFAKFDKDLGEKVEGRPEEQTELVSVNKFVTEPAKVTVDYGVTFNLGNYESVRIGVTVAVPCYFEEIDRAYKWATKWADERVTAEELAVRKALLDRAEDFI